MLGPNGMIIVHGKTEEGLEAEVVNVELTKAAMDFAKLEEIKKYIDLTTTT